MVMKTRAHDGIVTVFHKTTAGGLTFSYEIPVTNYTVTARVWMEGHITKGTQTKVNRMYFHIDDNQRLPSIFGQTLHIVVFHFCSMRPACGRSRGHRWPR